MLVSNTVQLLTNCCSIPANTAEMSFLHPRLYKYYSQTVKKTSYSHGCTPAIFLLSSPMGADVPCKVSCQQNEKCGFNTCFYGERAWRWRPCWIRHFEALIDIFELAIQQIWIQHTLIPLEMLCSKNKHEMPSALYTSTFSAKRPCLLLLSPKK